MLSKDSFAGSAGNIENVTIRKSNDTFNGKYQGKREFASLNDKK